MTVTRTHNTLEQQIAANRERWWQTWDAPWMPEHDERAHACGYDECRCGSCMEVRTAAEVLQIEFRRLSALQRMQSGS